MSPVFVCPRAVIRLHLLLQQKPREHSRPQLPPPHSCRQARNVLAAGTKPSKLGGRSAGLCPVRGGALASGGTDSRATLSICSARDRAAPSGSASGLPGSEEQLLGWEPHFSSVPELPGETGARRLLFPLCSTSISTSMPAATAEEANTCEPSGGPPGQGQGVGGGGSSSIVGGGRARGQPSSHKADGRSSDLQDPKGSLLPIPWPQTLAPRKCLLTCPPYWPCLFQLNETLISANIPGQLWSQKAHQEPVLPCVGSRLGTGSHTAEWPQSPGHSAQDRTKPHISWGRRGGGSDGNSRILLGFVGGPRGLKPRPAGRPRSLTQAHVPTAGTEGSHWCCF